MPGEKEKVKKRKKNIHVDKVKKRQLKREVSNLKVRKMSFAKHQPAHFQFLEPSLLHPFSILTLLILPSSFLSARQPHFLLLRPPSTPSISSSLLFSTLRSSLLLVPLLFSLLLHCLVLATVPLPLATLPLYDVTVQDVCVRVERLADQSVLDAETLTKGSSTSRGPNCMQQQTFPLATHQGHCDMQPILATKNVTHGQKDCFISSRFAR